MATCPDCGFDFDRMDRSEIPDRIRNGVAAACETLEANPDGAGTSPGPDRWSALEYGAHIRDVLLTIRDRSVVGIVDDNPGFMPMHREERIDLDLYRQDTVTDVSVELRASAAMYIRLLAVLDSEQLERPIRYGHPNPSPQTVGWMGLQAVHEVEHHLMDIRETLNLG